MFFRFPPDARWNAQRASVEFGIGVGEYEGVARIPRRVFQRLLDQAPTPERCLEAYHLQRSIDSFIRATHYPTSCCVPLSGKVAVAD